MSDIQQVLHEFKNNLIAFIDELIDQFQREPDLIIARIYLKDQTDIKDVMEIFTHNINKNDQIIKKMLKERNEVYFLENNTIFENVDKTKLAYFKKIWRSPDLDKENKNIIWKWIDSFIFFSDKYIKLKTTPSEV
jgi:hypothetical protein